MTLTITYSDGGAVISGVAEFDPAQIFYNGQCFRFTDIGDGVFRGVAHGRVLDVRAHNGDITLYPCSEDDFESIWRGYFDLGRDYGALFSGCDDEALQEGICYARGLRVLKQEPFETLISFIISANNNIKRIRGIIERICAMCGAHIDFEGETYYAFPTPGELAALSGEELYALGSGYRAPYIKHTACAIAQGYDLNAIGGLSYKDAKKELMKLKGVGPKVADCVLLFAYAKTDAFPADVWIKRVMQVLYGFEGSHTDIYEFAKKRFGEHAGIAQQYLFYYARENKLT